MLYQNSPRSEVVNINSMGVGHYSSMAQVLSSQAVPMAVSLAKGSQSLEPYVNHTFCIKFAIYLSVRF